MAAVDAVAAGRASTVVATPAPRVHIVVLNWNGWRDTTACLDAILELDHPSIVAIVCDNGSTDGSLARLAEWGEAHRDRGWTIDRHRDGPLATASNRAVVFVDNGANLGFAGGCNVGVRLALTDPACAYVWLLNNDTMVDRRALSTMVAACERDPRIGICGSQIRFAGARQRVQSQGGRLNRWFCTTHLLAAGAQPGPGADAAAGIDGPIDFVPGASMLVPRAYLEHVGLMSEEYFLYFEEIDWAERGRRRYRFAIEPASIVYHVGGASIGNASDHGERGLRADWYLLRGRLLFARKFYKRFLPTVYAGMLVSIAKRFVRGDRRRALVALYALVNRPVPWLAMKR